MTMGHQQTRLRTIDCKSETVDDIVQARLEDLQQIKTGQTAALIGNFVIAAELAFQNAIDAAGALLGAQLAQIIGLASGAIAAAAAGTAVLAGWEAASVDRALRRETTFAFQ